MKIISMEEFVLGVCMNKKESEAFKETLSRRAEIIESIFNYAKLLRTPMAIEHFHGDKAIVSIDGCEVTQGVNPAGEKISQHNLLFVIDDEVNDDAAELVGTTFSLRQGALFSVLSNFPGAKLTEYGIKQIFG